MYQMNMTPTVVIISSPDNLKRGTKA
jgi:hypothetical protein